jgi:hypothetical protein
MAAAPSAMPAANVNKDLNLMMFSWSGINSTGIAICGDDRHDPASQHVQTLRRRKGGDPENFADIPQIHHV